MCTDNQHRSHISPHVDSTLTGTSEHDLHPTTICDPLREKGSFDANIDFYLCMNIAVSVKFGTYPIFCMEGKYEPLPSFSRWSGSDPPILEHAVPS